MLCLTRKIGERILLTIGEVQVVVTLLDFGRGRAKLGFEAPRERVSIVREEVGALFVRPGEMERRNAQRKKAATAVTKPSPEPANRVEDADQLEWLDLEPGDTDQPHPG